MICPNDLKLLPIPPCKDYIELAMHFGNLFPVATKITEADRLAIVVTQAMKRNDDLIQTAYISGKQMAAGQLFVMHKDQ